MRRVLRILRHWLRETKGAVMVEFAVVVLVFLLILAGIIDLGLAFYTDQVVTNASREGARYGVVYQTDASGERISPSSLTPSITEHLLGNAPGEFNLSAYLCSDANPQVPPNSSWSSNTTGSSLTVTVTATYNWIVLNNFIPGLGTSKTISATTVMRLE
jgi:Flp pilus assembly protein TadG